MAIVHTRGFRPRVYTESAWYAPIAALLAPFDEGAAFPSPEALTALYAARVAPLALPPLRFVRAAKAKKPRRGALPISLAEIYEGRIIERGEVPTRPDDWHDLFNALAFLRFPRAKRALHARQYAILRARIAPGATRLPNARTREQDALSLFDEGGIAVAAAPGSDVAALAEDAPALAAAIARGQAVAVPFGHALYEHMVAALPVPLGTVHALEVPLPSGADPLDALDVALAESLADRSQFQLPSAARGCALSALEPRFTPNW